MDFAARDRHEMLDAMESCRADSGDLKDPQYAQLAALLADDSQLRVHFQRVQQSDAAIKAAICEVPLPADLAARVLHRLDESAAAGPIEPSVGSGDAGGDLPIPQQAEVLMPSRRVSRRRMLTSFAAVSASVAVAALVWLHFHQPLPLTHDDVLAKSMAFFAADNDPSGKLVSEIAPAGRVPHQPRSAAIGLNPLAAGREVAWRRSGGLRSSCNQRQGHALRLPPHGCRLAVFRPTGRI